MSRQDFQFCVQRLINDTCVGLEFYASLHADTYGSPVGDDIIIGDAGCLLILKGLRTLLNGETGSLNCAAMDQRLLACAKLLGFTEDEL